MHRARVFSFVISATLIVGWTGVTARADDQPPAWAYPVNPPNFKAPADDGMMRHVPNSDVSYSFFQTQDRFLAPDWHPNAHPPMPTIVASGRPPNVWACGFCHRANGSGGPESASLAGLPRAYILEQMADFKSGARQSSVPTRVPPKLMISFSKAITEPDVETAADYFASLKPRADIHVIQTDSVPKTRVAGWFLAADAGEKEPINGRIIEVPQNLAQFEDRDGRAEFVAYTPIGSVEKGRTLAEGTSGQTLRCSICHGPELKGLGTIPPIAGRSPSYLMRQLYDLKHGARAGANSALMKPVVEKLTTDDMTNLVAYVATLSR
jgi:cytochrome c553